MNNVESLPISDRSVIIRSVFRNPYGGGHPQTVPGYYSTQLLQRIEQLVTLYDEGSLDAYWDLIGFYIP